ncbi:hypothetical protein LSUE1_G007969, partial [Lachnellula suecica]
NSFAIQAASSTLKSGASWDFNDYHFRLQCDQLVPYPGIDTSVDCKGDENGIPEPDTNVIPNITDFASHLHGKGLKFGVYILLGAFRGDSGKVVEGTSVQIGSLFDGSQPGYNLRQTFEYEKDGV